MSIDKCFGVLEFRFLGRNGFFPYMGTFLWGDLDKDQ